MADKNYYQALNRQFGKYDVFCYELVGEKGSRPMKGGGRIRCLRNDRGGGLTSRGSSRGSTIRLRILCMPT